MIDVFRGSPEVPVILVLQHVGKGDSGDIRRALFDGEIEAQAMFLGLNDGYPRFFRPDSLLDSGCDIGIDYPLLLRPAHLRAVPALAVWGMFSASAALAVCTHASSRLSSFLRNFGKVRESNSFPAQSFSLHGSKRVIAQAGAVVFLAGMEMTLQAVIANPGRHPARPTELFLQCQPCLQGFVEHGAGIAHFVDVKCRKLGSADSLLSRIRARVAPNWHASFLSKAWSTPVPEHRQDGRRTCGALLSAQGLTRICSDPFSWSNLSL